MNLLAVDTATPWLVLGARRDGQIFTRTLQPEKTHGEVLLESLLGLMQEAQLDKNSLNAIVVGSGPGAFTGTRVGWALALGLAEGLGIPAVSVSTLDALGWEDNASGRSCQAVVDARRGRFYVGVYYRGELQGFYQDVDPRMAKNLPQRVVGPNALDYVQAAGGGGWQALEITDWGRGLLDLGADKLVRGDVIQPGQGPIYLRPYIDTTSF